LLQEHVSLLEAGLTRSQDAKRFAGAVMAAIALGTATPASANAPAKGTSAMSTTKLLVLGGAVLVPLLAGVRLYVTSNAAPKPAARVVATRSDKQAARLAPGAPDISGQRRLPTGESVAPSEAPTLADRVSNGSARPLLELDFEDGELPEVLFYGSVTTGPERPGNQHVAIAAFTPTWPQSYAVFLLAKQP
jgi:hypothetical protein